MTSNIASILLAKWQGNEQALREDYRSKLEHGVWIVEFDKVDGTKAVMECTLDPKLLPTEETTKTRADRSEDVISVFSLDREGWRSFRVANVTSFYQKPESL